MLTWTALVASALTKEITPVLGETGAAALFEIGGMEQTLQMTEREYPVVEPLFGGVVDDQGMQEAACRARDFRPRTIYVHADNLETYHHLEEILRDQRQSGGRSIVQVEGDSSLWEKPWWIALMEEMGARTEVEDGRRHVILENTGAENAEGAGDESAVYVVGTRGTGSTREADKNLCAISFEKTVPRQVQAALRRLHQNLWHPSREDLVRHLRLAGAGPEVVKGAKGMSCQVCERHKRAGTVRPSSEPVWLDFNQVVGVDVFTIHTPDDQKYDLLSIVDYGTSYHVAGLLPGHTAEEI